MKERFDYGIFVDSVQDGAKIHQNLAVFAQFFTRCRHVLDLGCGSGHFLQVLRDAGIEGLGVDADCRMTNRAESDGLKAVHSDVRQFLLNSREDFDGVFCSHLIEHLPFEALVDLIEGIYQVLKPGGVVVFAFPNPESLEMQLFHFWLDPQHVRFYHPALIEAMLVHYGLEVTDKRFRHWRDGGTWFTRNGNTNHDSVAREHRFARRAGRRLKQFLGITRLENEIDYLTRLKRIGEEAVIVARKND